ncbi:MAG: hypothetical protein HQL44_10370 [Alphaproteobacteria bacterium]|nr:hypothetical protein [Alphaproteobacteria bacterium]
MENEKKHHRSMKERLAAIEEKEARLKAARQVLLSRWRESQKGIDLRMKLRLAESYIASLARLAFKSPERHQEIRDRLENLLKFESAAVREAAQRHFQKSLARLTDKSQTGVLAAPAPRLRPSGNDFSTGPMAGLAVAQ